MKDYSLNVEQSKSFILSYVVKNDKIVVKLASGEKNIIPYNEENEKKILDCMEKQVENTSDIEAECKETIRSERYWVNSNAILLCLVEILIDLGLPLCLISYILLIIPSLEIVNSIIKWNKAELKLRDIKKQKYFLTNQEQLNTNAKKNENVLLCVSKKAKKQIEQSPIEKPIFDINTIDGYSLSDLKTLIYNIERDCNFDFNQQHTADSEERGQARILKPKNDNQ